MEISFLNQGFKLNLFAKISIIIFFILDIIMKLNTIYIDRGIYIRERTAIIKHYFYNGFLSDLISLISLLY